MANPSTRKAISDALSRGQAEAIRMIRQRYSSGGGSSRPTTDPNAQRRAELERQGYTTVEANAIIRGIPVDSSIKEQRTGEARKEIATFSARIGNTFYTGLTQKEAETGRLAPQTVASKDVRQTAQVRMQQNIQSKLQRGVPLTASEQFVQQTGKAPTLTNLNQVLRQTEDPRVAKVVQQNLASLRQYQDSAKKASVGSREYKTAITEIRGVLEQNNVIRKGAPYSDDFLIGQYDNLLKRVDRNIIPIGTKIRLPEVRTANQAFQSTISAIEKTSFKVDKGSRRVSEILNDTFDKLERTRDKEGKEKILTGMKKELTFVVGSAFLGGLRGVNNVYYAVTNPIDLVKGLGRFAKDLATDPSRIAQLVVNDFIRDPYGTATELGLSAYVGGKVRKYSALNPVTRYVAELKLIYSLPKELRLPTRKILASARAQRKLSPVPKPSKIDFFEVKNLKPVEAQALKVALTNTDSVIFGSASARALSGKATKIPSDVDLATKSISKFNQEFINALPPSLRKNYIIKAEKIVRRSDGTPILDVKPMDRLRPDKYFLTGKGRLPVYAPKATIGKVKKPTLQDSGLQIFTEPTVKIGKFRAISFGEQTLRKALGTLQVLFEKNLRRAKDISGFVESLKIQVRGLRRAKPKTIVGRTLNQRKIRVLSDTIKYLESPAFKRIVDKVSPSILRDYPITARLQRLAKVTRKEIPKSVRQKLNQPVTRRRINRLRNRVNARLRGVKPTPAQRNNINKLIEDTALDKKGSLNQLRNKISTLRLDAKRGSIAKRVNSRLRGRKLNQAQKNRVDSLISDVAKGKSGASSRLASVIRSIRSRTPLSKTPSRLPSRVKVSRTPSRLSISRTPVSRVPSKTPVSKTPVSKTPSRTPISRTPTSRLPSRMPPIKQPISKLPLVVRKKLTPPPKGIGKYRLDWDTKLPKGYVRIVDGFVRVRGQRKRVNLRTTPNRALQEMTRLVDNTLARSFELKIIGIKKGKDIGVPPSLRKFRPKKSRGTGVLRVVERTKFAIDSVGEKKGLMVNRRKVAEIENRIRKARKYYPVKDARAVKKRKAKKGGKKK